MRIAARTSSAGEDAPADFPTWPERLQSWRERAAQTDWTPWLIVGLGAFLRFFLLGIKPAHFDEGINGWFVDQMTKTGFYRYDPTNYHGPLHFYVLFLSQALLGRNIWALRLPVVLVSIGSIWLALKFDRLVGRNVARLAALAMAISPAFIFYGRYSIHEVWLLLFSILFLFGLLGLWKFGTRGYLWCTGMGIAGMILTKETYIIHLICAGLAIPVTLISHRLDPLPEAKPARQTWTAIDLTVVIAASVALIVFFYSGTFLNWDGVKGLYETFGAWFKTGTNGNGHEKPWPYWLELILRYEWPVCIGFFLCAACQFFRNFAIRYLAVYGIGVFAAYSIIHYKTPWIIISMVWPLLFVFAAGVTAPRIPRRAFYLVSLVGLGFALGWIASYLVQPASLRATCSFSAYLREAFRVTLAASSTSTVCGEIGERLYGTAIVGAALGGAVALFWPAPSSRLNEEVMNGVRRGVSGTALLASLAVAISLNYFHYTTDTEPYVYVQTYKDIDELTRPVLTLAHRNPAFYQMVGHMIRTSAYPFPWILGDFPKVGYYENGALPTKMDADFLLVEEDRVAAVEKQLRDSYYTMPLRIRPYQDTSKLYLRAARFKEFFPGRKPDFVGKGSQ